MMRLLLDTQTWLWAILGDSQLSDDTRATISRRTNEVFFSAASAWEIAIKVGIGKLVLPGWSADFIPVRLERDGIQPLAIETRHAVAVASLPPHHKDPFDRLIIAQAQLLGLTIVTSDSMFEAYDVPLLKAC